jgi:hypothetical protein
MGRSAPNGTPRAATLERLRSLVGSRGRVGVLPPAAGGRAAAIDIGSISTGNADLDVWLHGWPRPGPVEIAGRIGAGRLALVGAVLETLTRSGRHVVVVDALQQLHPPGLGRVDLSRVVLVRPPAERASWVAEQVARSGAAEALILLDAPPLGRGGVRLARAAEAGDVLTFVLSQRPEPELPAGLRLEVDGWRGGARLAVRCTRSRDGRRLGERLITLGVAPTEPSESRTLCARSGEIQERLRAGGA